MLKSIDEAPYELADAVREFWLPDDWDAAVSIAFLESGWDAFALNDTTSEQDPCGSLMYQRDGVWIRAEKSVGYFQINACNFPGWEWQRLYNARHNAGTAHMLFETRSWRPWYFSARSLGLLS